MLADQVNTVFRAFPVSGPMVELTLLKAPPAPRSPDGLRGRPADDAGNEKFSLIFSGPQDGSLASAIHRFEHDRLGRFEMYVGRIGTEDRERGRYESVFNRPPPAARVFS